MPQVAVERRQHCQLAAHLGRRDVTGALLFRDGLSLRDVLEGFTFFRKRLDEAAREEAQKNDLSADEVLEMWEHLSNLADQELLSVAESYDEAAMATLARR